MRQADAFLPQLALGLSTAHLVAVGLLSTWPNRPPELRATRWACAEVDEALGLFRYNPATAAEYLKQVEEASALLQQLAEEQRKAIREAGVEAG